MVTLSADQINGLKSIVEWAGASAVRVESESQGKATEVTVDVFSHTNGWDKGWKLRASGSFRQPGDVNVWHAP